EALSRDSLKADFLINTYSFSYVYSARYLMTRYEKASGNGDFIGIAPVSFPANSGLADLKRSEDALRNCSKFYRHSKLLTHADASRRNFLQQVAGYNTASILTHAKADSSDEEPLLFMSDSAIHLSELQMLIKPAAKFIVLSACQTNAGRNRNGEGIFSLARGLSAAGIPSVAATQWVADEQAIYIISEKLNEYIAAGMNKDEALRKAKLFYILRDKRANILPYYWADMILIGNTEPLEFSAGLKMNRIIAGSVLVVLLALFFFLLRFNKR
ncbi:MAG TPA: CHAT domain-containing protein, partial [Puia sp.]|nr:CHAT domain-containing protein [Puia sp.]